ncbi:MAG TPA: hypothetical protein DCQ93_08525 [Bacteroidetes bacterium]|nr:hypothetical protein [Bacteroidota bacterium]
MLARIFDSSLIDIILFILAIRFLFPHLFTIRLIRSEKKQERITILHKEETRNKADENHGEYVEFEEVK